MTPRVASIALALLALPFAASAMTVEEYLTKMDAAKSQSLMTIMASPDRAAILAEMRAIKVSYRADVDAARAKGKKTMGCPPPAGQARLDGAELERKFRAMPLAARKQTSLKTGIFNFMRDRYPCT